MASAKEIAKSVFGGQTIKPSNYQTIKPSKFGGQTIKPSNHQTIKPSKFGGQTIEPSNHQTIEPSNHRTIEPSNSKLMKYLSGGGIEAFTRTAEEERAETKQEKFLFAVAAIGIAWLLFWIF